MHIGGVRTALFAWLWARKNGGTFILRIEDTDREREVEGSLEHIMESLRWLGLTWDYGPESPGPWGSNIQSERLDTYRAAAQTLIDKGLAYADPYTPEEVEGFRQAAAAEMRPFLYRDHRPEHPGAWDGTRALRLKVPKVMRYEWHDEVRGDLSAGEEALDDFILIKSDGFPTYNFAHIVDDAAMGVTHIFRADEFISSTPRFLSLYDALEIPYPKFVTLPPILRADRAKKLGKRDGSKDILEYREEGILPEAMVNFLALIGWNPGTEEEVFLERTDLVRAFTLEGIQTGGGAVNEEKLRWFNKQHLAAVPDDAFLRAAAPRLEHTLGVALAPEALARLLPLLRERITQWSDIDTAAETGEWDFARPGLPEIDHTLLPGKNGTPEGAQAHLKHVADILEALPAPSFDDPELVKQALWEYAEAAGRGAVLWPLRYALSGRERSPDPFTIAAVIGKESTLARVSHAIEVLIH
jgi:glutamyl-tRNA synthetase